MSYHHSLVFHCVIDDKYKLIDHSVLEEDEASAKKHPRYLIQFESHHQTWDFPSPKNLIFELIESYHELLLDPTDNVLTCISAHVSLSILQEPCLVELRTPHFIYKVSQEYAVLELIIVL